MINPGLAALLAACDGHADCAAIVRGLRAQANAQGDDEADLHRVFAVLERLRAKNVLTYRKPLNRKAGNR